MGKRLTRAQKERRDNRRMEQTFATANVSRNSPTLILSGYEAANDSPMRGYVHFPGRGDTRRELDQMSDREIRRRVHFLFANLGIARRILLNQARLLGYLRPRPMTADREWNREIMRIWRQTATVPNVFDVRGKMDFYSAQIRTNIERRKDGRCLGVLTRTGSGNPAMAFYEASQIESGGAYSSYEEGVQLSRLDRHLGYSVRDGKDPSQFTRVDASDSVYFGNWDNLGRVHGQSILASAVPNLLDVVELRGMRKHGAKMHAAIGLVVEQSNGTAIRLPTGEVLGIPGVREVETEQQTTTEDEDGNPVTTTQTVLKPVTFEQIVQGGAYPALEPGQTVRVIADDRPTPNNLEFERILLDDAAFCDGLPAAVTYHLADLKGPGVRYSMEEVRRWILLTHRMQAQECQRFWSYFCALAINSGKIWMPRADGKDLPYWRDLEWVGLPDMTIDSGRDGQLAISRVHNGLSTWSLEWSREEGLDAEEMIYEQIHAFAAAKAECIRAGEAKGVSVELGEVFPGFAQGRMMTQQAASQDLAA